MPCADSSSGLTIRLTADERFYHFDFTKITCSRPIQGGTGLSEFCAGKTLNAILALPFETACRDLDLHDDEACFILHLELDALKAGILRYLGRDGQSPDHERYLVSAIECHDEFIDISIVILPPKDMPAVKSCCSMKKDA
jgi:hypothetical protein